MSLATFRGGVHPPDKKELSKGAAIEKAKAPKAIAVPLSQHIGAPNNPIVEIGQEVKMGEIVGQAEAFVSAPVHSSVSGKVVGLVDFPMPIGRMIQSVVIENDEQDTWAPLVDEPKYMELDPDALKQKIRAAGIVGMGGAAFPTSVKLSPPKEKPINTVIINGAECEPYLNADYRLMMERPVDIVEGLKILMRVLGVNKGYIGIENNKPDAVKVMKDAASGEANIKVEACEVKYPQGAEKMLIKALTGREVPNKGGLPMEVGVVVQNVGTAIAIYEAVRFGKPLIERVVSVTGEAVNEPKNLLTRVGTLVSDVIEQCGGLKGDCAKVISGGPMMGFALYTLETPVTKGTSGILALPAEKLAHADRFQPCIRCGRCIDVCPMHLMPQMLSIFSEAGFYEEAKEYNLWDCFECGTCSFVCPANRPIVQLVRLAKSQTKP
jgi:electron transport complex protein RnfC